MTSIPLLKIIMRARLLRPALPLVATLAAVVCPLRDAGRAAAQASYPPAHALALPRSTFPRWMSVHGDAVTDETAAAATRLHAISLGDAGRIEGYLETTSWMQRSRSERVARSMRLLYSASIFSSPRGAETAYGDVRASLWELGYARRERIGNAPIFEIAERDGLRDALVLLHQGSIEAELRLRYSAASSNQSVQAGLWYLWHTFGVAAGVVSRVDAGLPQPPPPAGGTTPPIVTAPWGTGPVIKSPSLMALEDAQLPAGGSVDPGSFRPDGSPPLAPQTTRHPLVVAPRALVRYVQTGTAHGLLFDATALYGSPGAAAAGFDAIAAANDGLHGLQPYSLSPPWSAGHLASVDASRAWQQGAERIFALRVQNVVLVLAETDESPDTMASLADRLVATVPTWLRAQGTDLVNSAGDRVRLTGLNWYGAEQQDFVVGGLDYQSYRTILQTIKRLGYNCIRLPFSNQLVEQNPIVSSHLSANTELAGLHALDIMDRIISYAGALGLSVILDNHRSDAGWSAEENGLWYTQAYPDTAFVGDWTTMAKRYAQTNAVIAADLRNEPHATATWGDGNPATDWLAAAERAGNAALAVDPHLLIMVEGVQYYGGSGSYWWGGNLLGVATAPVVLHFADGSPARSQLVYSAHDYGPDNCLTGCTWFNATTTYDTLAQLWTHFWGYIMADPAQPYAAPVWVGEFGTCDYQESCVSDTTPGSQGQWFSSLVRYIAERHLGWAYWSVNATQSTGGTRVYGAVDWYGYFTQDWSAPRPLLDTALRSIQGEGTPGTDRGY